MNDFVVMVALCTLLSVGCLLGLIYLLARDAIECLVAFLAALAADWWRSHHGRHRAPVQDVPSWASDAAWQRDVELTR